MNRTENEKKESAEHEKQRQEREKSFKEKLDPMSSQIGRSETFWRLSEKKLTGEDDNEN